MVNQDIVLPGRSGSYDKIVFKLPFSADAVFQVYIGGQGCACGCHGKYYTRDGKDQYDMEHAAQNAKKHNRMIKFAYNKVKKMGALKGIQVIGDYIYSYETDTRAIRLYLHD